VFQQAFDAFARGDLDGMVALADPEILVYIPENPDQQVWKGREQALQAVKSWTGAFDDYAVELVSLEEHGDQIYAVVDQSGVSPLIGARVEARIIYVVTVREGRVARWDLYIDENDARAALA